jgi:hypothetical protein
MVSRPPAAHTRRRRQQGGTLDGQPPPSKKRNTAVASGALNVPVCTRCGGVVPQMSLRVACLDGETLDLTVATRSTVDEVKRAVGEARNVQPALLDLFQDGTEDALPGAARLPSLQVVDGSVLFMLQRLDWRWNNCGTNVKLSGEGLVATNSAAAWNLVTGGEPMTEGRHYWEVELTTDPQGGLWFMFGAVRPGLDHDKSHAATNNAHYINTNNGALYGNGKGGENTQGKFAAGDRVGALLDVDAGWLRFYRNGKRCGPGFTEGVTGPLVRAGAIGYGDSVLTALPGAQPD